MRTISEWGRCPGHPFSPTPPAQEPGSPDREGMTQTADTPPGHPRAPFLDEVKSAVTPRAAPLVIGVIALQPLFIEYGRQTRRPAARAHPADHHGARTGRRRARRCRDRRAGPRRAARQRHGAVGAGHALIIFAVGAATLALQCLFGIVGIAGIGLAILVIVIAGNPSAGGAFPPPMLPPFWNAIGPALPPGAGTRAVRSLASFKGNAVAGPLLVPAAWAAAGLVITMAASVFRGRRKPGPGAPRTLIP